MGRWFGLGGQTKALLLAPLVRQRMRVFVVRHNSEDLAVLKELFEASELAPVIDRRYALSEVPELYATANAKGGICRARIRSRRYG